MTTIRPHNSLAAYKNPLAGIPETLAEAEAVKPSHLRIAEQMARTPPKSQHVPAVQGGHASAKASRRLDAYA